MQNSMTRGQFAAGPSLATDDALSTGLFRLLMECWLDRGEHRLQRDVHRLGHEGLLADFETARRA